MNILYGVCGDGNGHVTRSAVVGEHLLARGHGVTFVSSGAGYRTLARRWPGRVCAIIGATHHASKNRVRPVFTLVHNLITQTAALPAHLVSFFNIGKRPDVVISDFDAWTSTYAKIVGVPLIAVDNMHFMTRCVHPSDVVSGDRTAAAITVPIVNSMVPNAQRYLVTTFVTAKQIHDRTTLHAPILRRSILGATPSNGSHVCVYFNHIADHGEIARALQSAPGEFRLYGATDVHVDTRMGNVLLRPSSEARFVEDLATAKAVIGGAGFTLMSEAIFLHKPMLAVPLEMQFEQILNANYLQRMGFGERETSDLQGIRKFLLAADQYREKLRSYSHDGNRELLAAVDEAIRG